MKVRDVINPQPIWVSGTESVVSVAHLMQDSDCAFLPVVEDSRAVGIVTDRDVALALGIHGFNPSTTKVRDVMTPEPESIDADCSLEEAASQIIAKGVHRLVVEKNGEFVGVISIVDLAGLIPDSRVAQTLRMLADRNHPHFVHRERHVAG